MPFQQSKSQMEQIFDQTLDRLREGKIKTPWWKKILSITGRNYISLDVLKKPAVQDWLAQDQVVSDLYLLAENRIRNTRENPEIYIRLATSYSQCTGEINQNADLLIRTIVSILEKGYLSEIPSDQRPGIGLSQSISQNINARFDRLEEGLLHATDPITQKNQTEQADKILSKILATRALNSPKARQNIQELWQQVSGGNLSLTDDHTKLKISYWTARLCASDPKTLSISRQILAELRRLDTDLNLSIVDALLADAGGDTDRALHILRDQSEAESRSVLEIILTHSKSPQDALTWYGEENAHNDPLFFTAIGWINWAINMAKVNKWKEATQQLVKIESSELETPALRFIEGIVNAAMLLPEEMRGIALEKVPVYKDVALNLEAEVATYHARATTCFEFAHKNLVDVLDHELKQFVADWRLWLRLMNPNTEVSKIVRQDISQKMEDGKQAANLMMFAWAFNITFSEEPLKRYLKHRKQFGGLDDRDFLAEFLLAETSKTSHDLAIYIEHNETHLKQMIPPVVVTGINIEVLVEDGQLKKAREVLEINQDDLDEESVHRLTAMIEAGEGKDIRLQLENNYHRTNSLIDLQNLVEHLRRVNDHEMLRPLLYELFQRHSTPENAHNYVACLTQHPFTDYEEIVRFLDANSNIFSENDDLMAIKAQALFQIGRFKDSKIINDELILKRRHQNDLLLDIDITIATGEWEQIPGIIHREWPQRDSHTSETLMALAQLAGQYVQDTNRALRLALLAVEKTPDDPHILMATYALHVQLGRENEVDPNWLAHAFELSSPDEGPLWRIDLPDLIERIPQHSEHIHAVEREWLEGKIPTSLAARLFNMPLTRLFIKIPDENIVELDGRRRTMLPIIAGGRSSVELQKNWTVGLDITSIIILSNLGLLDKMIDSFECVKIAPETMTFLMLEKNKILFHQPSQIKAARQLQGLVNSSHIQMVSTSKAPPSTIANEVGSELAALLQQAKSKSGKVVCVLPIYKVESLMNKEADLSGYKDQIISVVDFCAALHKAGRVSTGDYNQIMSFLRSQNQTEYADVSRSVLDKTIFVDRLALSYIQNAGVLQSVSTSGLDIQMHPNISADMDALIRAEDTSSYLAEQIEKIRNTIRSAIDSGTILFLPHNSKKEKKSDHLDIQSQATTSLLATCNAYNVLCSDDRYINGRPTIRNDADVASVACVLDILRHLVSCERLSDINHWNMRHRLRQGGLVFVPFEAEELIHWIKSTAYDETGLKETVELRIIRQTTARTNYLGLASLQETIALSADITSACTTAIRSLWSEESVSIEQATVLSNWVWRHLMVTATLARQHADQDIYLNRLHTTMVNRLASLYIPIHACSEERQTSYAGWVNQSILESFWPANANVVKEAVEVTCDAILSLDENRMNQYGYWFLKFLPENLRRIVREKSDFSERFGLQARNTFNLGTDISLTDIDLFVAAKEVLSGSKNKIILKSDGGKVSISLDVEDGHIVLEWRDKNSSSQRAKLPDFALLSADPKIRVKKFHDLVKRLGPTAPNFQQLIQKTKVQELNYDELSNIFEEVFNGVTATQYELSNKIQNSFIVSDIVPNSLSYFERFVGLPPDKETPEAYIHGSLAKYRRALLNKDLEAGLDICCLGALHDDLSPGQWVQSIESDTLWDALSSCKIQDDPFSLLGALDIALYRQDDIRFEKFCVDAVNKLTDVKFGQDEDTDVWELITIFVTLIHNQINILENGPNYPSYWKRMCAWMQAGLIVRILGKQSSKDDIRSLRDWAHESMAINGLYAACVDARQEPMHLVPQTLRNEVLDRLLTLKLRHENEGRTIPGSNSIDQAIDQRKDSEQPFVPNLPGLLEGHKRPSQHVPGKIKEELKLHGIENLESYPWSAAAAVSQSFSLGEPELEDIRKAVKLITKDASPLNLNEKLQSLNLACIVAVTNGDKALADTVAENYYLLSKQYIEN